MIKTAPLLAALLLAACSTTPELKAPALPMPAAFKESQQPLVAADGTQWKVARPAESQPRGQWWLAFHDPELTGLIGQATEANANLAVAAARVKQARALAGIAEADRGVQVGAGVGAHRGASPTVAQATSYQAKLTASYEVDLFGRIGAGVSAAQADAAGSEATYKSVLLALQADVAQTYFRLRSTDAELATLAKSVDLRAQSVKGNQSRFDNGDIGEFDLVRAKADLAAARAEAIGLQRQRVQLEHALAVLLGKPAAAFSAQANPLLETTLLPVIPAGLPSQLLERRPDVAAAQRAMVASNARIGEARAAMFPALGLSAAGGGESTALSNVLKLSGRSWMLGALLSMPIIDGGRNKANVARSEAVLEESVAAYRQNVLVAFAEVEDNLAGLRILAGQSEQVEAGVVLARRSADLAQKLYQAGRSSYLDLLDAQRNLALVERNAAQLRGNQAVTTVALIRSLGGGWEI
ncbi:efflux transporter outer membrane subunit [Massilia sp. R2A-15]|uniref:efflux transporter outer membrane subunit n=1 Tax=Massilia sp. R2A-15 TaxID=3064278 RepID=UPI00273649A9|nr:efflux transporter outer membrane subunit [Massilia sp. R2A-15]WLI90908.1 efflux transporter outer membrane subunit [Massilia sp. R2A-15]